MKFKGLLSVLLSLALLSGTASGVYALDARVSGTTSPILASVTLKTYARNARITTPPQWVRGKNLFNIQSDDVCVVCVKHSDGTYTAAKCFADDVKGYNFSVDLQSGDAIEVAYLGDINLNGEVNASDYPLLAQHIFGYSLVTDATALTAADINSNGSVNASDYPPLAQYIFGHLDLEWPLMDESEIPDVTDPKPDPEPEENHAPTAAIDLVQVNMPDQVTGYNRDVAQKVVASLSAADEDGDKNVALYYKLDDGSWLLYDGELTHVGYAASGEHTLYAKAVDSKGAESDIVSQVFTVERVSTLPRLTAVNRVSQSLGQVYKVHIDQSKYISDPEVYEVAKTVWTLRDSAGTVLWSGDFFTSEKNVTDISGNAGGKMSKYGGEFKILSETGIYTLQAQSYDESGNLIEMEIDTVPLKATNQAPNAVSALAGLSTEVDRNDVLNAYVEGEAKAKVHFVFDDTGVDADGDTVMLYDADTDLPLEDGYYPVGDTVINLYAKDQWGMESSRFTFTVRVANTAPDAPAITVTKYPTNVKFTDGKWTMYVGMDIALSDPDSDQTRLIYESEQSSGYYNTGSYIVSAYAMDIFGVKSALASEAFTVDTVFVLTAESSGADKVNESGTELWLHAGTPLTLNLTAGEYEVFSTEFRCFLGGDDVAEEIGAFGDGEAAMDKSGEGFSLEWTPKESGDFVCEVRAKVRDSASITGEYTYLTSKVTVHVTNTAPGAPVLSAVVDKTDSQTVDGVLAYKVTITAQSVDPDDDTTEIMWDKANLTSGYYPVGVYAVRGVYAVDQWGMKSEANTEFLFTVS